jgi:hypothetical protein
LRNSQRRDSILLWNVSLRNQATSLKTLSGGVNERNGNISPIITGNYNSAVVRRTKVEPSVRPFKGSGRIRERGSDAWFPIEFLTYHDDRNRLHSFAYVRREDGGEIPDGHYVFLDELGEPTSLVGLAITPSELPLAFPLPPSESDVSLVTAIHHGLARKSPAYPADSEP